MYLRTILTALGTAALAAAAHAASPCLAPTHAGCGTPALTASAKVYAPAGPLAQALADRQSKLGAEHPLTLATANALAMMYKAKGRYNEAEALYLSSLETCERVLGLRHPLTLGTAKALASLYTATGRYPEAALVYQRAGISDPHEYNY